MQAGRPAAAQPRCSQAARCFSRRRPAPLPGGLPTPDNRGSPRNHLPTTHTHTHFPLPNRPQVQQVGGAEQPAAAVACAGLPLLRGPPVPHPVHPQHQDGGHIHLIHAGHEGEPDGLPVRAGRRRWWRGGAAAVKWHAALAGSRSWQRAHLRDAATPQRCELSITGWPPALGRPSARGPCCRRCGAPGSLPPLQQSGVVLRQVQGQARVHGVPVGREGAAARVPGVHRWAGGPVPLPPSAARRPRRRPWLQRPAAGA